MDAAREPASGGATAQADGRGPARDLQGLLRAVAARAAETTGGAVLLFVRGASGEPPRLRAAAGIPSPDAARTASASLIPAVEQTLRDGGVRELEPVPTLGARAAGGLRIFPLVADGVARGALVIGTASPATAETRGALELAAEGLAARLEQNDLRDELERVRAELAEREQTLEAKSDELLKLSEALFTQDIELLRNNEKLGKIEKLKNDFIEKMSRELRTPLNSIIESVIAVLAGENDVLSETARQSLRAALDDGTAFLRTLQNILDLWRIKQGELPVELQDVNFREVVEEAIFSVQDSIGTVPVSIETQFEEPLPKIRTDLAKVNHVLFLLLDNAVKFTTKGTIEIQAKVAEGRLVCSVADTGIGIAPDDQQFIFDEFYQVDELASTKYRGSGLGLALVRDLLILLDGEISLSSEVGKGSTFTFQVPVQVLG